jgi:hypothetical protein
VLDLIDAIADLLEPPATRSTKLDPALGAEPFAYDSADTLYLFEWGPDVRDLAGASGSDLERFAIQAVYVADSKDEEPKQKRRRDVTEALDAKREHYAQRIRQHRSGASWSHLQAVIDGDYIRAFEIRGFALRISGWRIIPA